MSEEWTRYSVLLSLRVMVNLDWCSVQWCFYLRVMFLLSSSVLFPNVIQTAFALGLSFIRPVCFDYCLVCEQFSVKDPEQLIFLTC